MVDVTQDGGEQAAWDWLDQTVSATCDEHPSDLAYEAEQMVAAFIAGARLPQPATDAGWSSDMESAPRDKPILLLAHGMAIEARYSGGEWSEDTPNGPAEYSGAAWVAFDDAVQFEIEEGAGPDGTDLHGPVTHWRPLPTPPAEPST